MDAREQRGLEIANKSKLTQKNGLWLVPSENSNQQYTVDPNPEKPHCNCRDFEFRRATCKHIHAVLPPSGRIKMRNVLLENQLCDAIKRHQVIRLRYKGQLYSRTFEPYIIYRSTKDNILLGGTQTKDDSQPLKNPQPHNFEVELISALTVTDETFKYDERFDPTDDMYRNGIICVIKRVKVSE